MAATTKTTAKMTILMVFTSSTGVLPVHAIQWICCPGGRPSWPVGEGLDRTCRRLWPRGWSASGEERHDGGHVRHVLHRCPARAFHSPAAVVACWRPPWLLRCARGLRPKGGVPVACDHRASCPLVRQPRSVYSSIM